jgi:hypothetical protein
MKNVSQLWATGGIAVVLAFSATPVMAQGAPGGFGGGMVLSSPARLQQQADNMRITLAVTNDDEWSVISPRLVRVIQLKAEVRAAELADMLGGMTGGRGGGGIRTAATALGVGADPASQALSKAISDEAPAAELKAKMVSFRQARKAKQAEITRAEADLQAVVSIRQEAILLSNGLLE